MQDVMENGLSNIYSKKLKWELAELAVCNYLLFAGWDILKTLYQQQLTICWKLNGYHSHLMLNSHQIYWGWGEEELALFALTWLLSVLLSSIKMSKVEHDEQISVVDWTYRHHIFCQHINMSIMCKGYWSYKTMSFQLPVA